MLVTTLTAFAVIAVTLWLGGVFNGLICGGDCGSAAVRTPDELNLVPTELAVEPADGGRRDAQARGQLGRGLRTVLQDQGAHAVARAPVVGCHRRAGVHCNAFHNTSVSYFSALATKGGLTSPGRGDAA